MRPVLGASLAAVLVGYPVGAVPALLITRSAQENLDAATEPAG
jgi:hypothetical protein